MRARAVLGCAVLAGAALIACVRGNSAAPVTPIDVGNATGAGAIGDVPAAKGTCAIRAQASTFDLKIRAGDETIEMRIMDLPTESEIERDGNALVHVRSAIEFDGRLALAHATDDSERSLHVTREVTLLGGLVKLGKETELVRARRVDDAATGVVVLGGSEIEDVPIPCDALVIDERSMAPAMQLTTTDDEDSDDQRVITWVGPHGDVLPICSTPEGAPPCIHTKEMALEEVRRTASAVEVRARFDDDSVIRGWVKAEHVTRTDEPIRMGYGASVGCGCGRPILSHLSVGKPDPRAHFGKARLLAGASIHAVPELRGAWAKASRDVEIEIEMHGPDDHARVRDLPGITTTIGCNCPGIGDHAWVKRESVVPIR